MQIWKFDFESNRIESHALYFIINEQINQIQLKHLIII